MLALAADVVDAEGYMVLRASDPREAAKLRSLCPGIKVLLMSAFTSGAIEVHGIHIAPGEALLVKPFTVLGSSTKVRTLLAHRSPLFETKSTVSIAIAKKGATAPWENKKMNEVVEKVVRAEVDRLLRIDYSGKPVCVDCLAGTIPAGSGPPFTRIEVRRAVREMTQSPGSLDYLRSFLCHLCKEEGACLISTTTK